MDAACTALGIPNFCQSSCLIFPVKHLLHPWTMQDAKWSLVHRTQQTSASVMFSHLFAGFSVSLTSSQPQSIRNVYFEKKVVLWLPYIAVAHVHKQVSTYAHPYTPHTTHKCIFVCIFKLKKTLFHQQNHLVLSLWSMWGNWCSALWVLKEPSRAETFTS